MADRYISVNKLKHDMEFVMQDTTCPLHIAATIDQIIHLQPDADVEEVKHGEWIKPQFVAHSGFYTVKEFECSVCNKVYEVKQPCNLMIYCPYCGAKNGKEV